MHAISTDGIVLILQYRQYAYNRRLGISDDRLAKVFGEDLAPQLEQLYQQELELMAGEVPA